MTYTQAYSKIIDAYFKDEILPFDSSFCFCGTLHGSYEWNIYSYSDFPNDSPYSLREYKKIERALFGGNEFSIPTKRSENYEDYLFKGMCKALDVLKEIHESRGEIIDEPIQFKKRELVTV